MSETAYDLYREISSGSRATGVLMSEPAPLRIVEVTPTQLLDQKVAGIIADYSLHATQIIQPPQLDIFRSYPTGQSVFHFALPFGGRILSSEERSTLQKSFTLCDEDAVLDFIGKNDFLLPLLLDAVPQIKKHFSRETFRLELLCDPETGNDELMLYIVTQQDPEMALKLLRKFDQQWWILNVVRSNNRLCIHITYDV